MKTSGVLRKKRKAAVGAAMAIAVSATAATAGWAVVAGEQGRVVPLAEARQQASESVSTPDPRGREPVYGTEYVRPTDDEWKKQPPQESPLWVFIERYNRVPQLDTENNQVGYVDLRDMFGRDAPEVKNVKDKDGNVVGTVSTTEPFRRAAQ